MMRTKTLVKKFSYNSISEECPKQGWRLPTLEEARKIKTDLDSFWIQTDIEIDDERLNLAYFPNSGNTDVVNKSFQLPTIVMVEEFTAFDTDTCERYLHTCDEEEANRLVEMLLLRLIKK